MGYASASVLRGQPSAVCTGLTTGSNQERAILYQTSRRQFGAGSILGVLRPWSEWEVGRIYETRGGPDNLRWFWLMTVNGPMTRSDRVATLEEAKAQFQKAGTHGRRGRKLEEME